MSAERKCLNLRGNDKMWTITVDDGKPYDIKVKTKKSLKKHLIKLGKEAQHLDEEFETLDVFVYDEKDNDVTDRVFKELGLNEMFGL